MTDGPLAPGQRVERYTVERPLGEGGMATVYLVRHEALGSLHALKVLHVRVPGLSQRLVQEGRAQASLRHPNVVAVTDVVEVGDVLGLVMEYVPGPTMEDWLSRGRPSLAEAEALFRGVVAGVARAHKAGWVHRDLKPANVLLDPQEDGTYVPKVSDFGLAKILGDETTLGRTRSGATMGTPWYMAPEQARDAKNVDARADIFALGCLLYELCTGQRPFGGDNVLDVFANLAKGDYPPPERFDPALPTRVRLAITGALTTDRDARIGTCSALLDVLDGKVTDTWSTRTSIPDLSAMPTLSSASAAPEPAAPIWRAAAAVGAAALASAGLFVVLAARLLGASDAPPPALPVQSQSVQPPVVVEIPAPVEAPAPAPPPAPIIAAPAPPAPPTGGAVEVVGAPTAWLERNSQRIEVVEGRAAGLPPGEYRLRADFGAGPITTRFALAAGDVVHIRCEAAFQICTVK